MFMNSKQLGIVLTIISVVVLISLVVFIRQFDKHLTQACVEACGTAEGSVCTAAACPYNQGKGLLWVPIGASILIAMIGGIGLFLAFSKNEKIIRQKEYDISRLSEDEKKAFLFIKVAKEGIYQSELVQKLDISKVKVTRILDALEQQGIIERKRRGMTNVVMLK